MRIKCINIIINNVCLGYQLTVIATGKEEDSFIIIKNLKSNNNNMINELVVWNINFLIYFEF